MTEIVLGTRGSPLALAQAQIVERLLRTHHESLHIHRHVIKTHGDEESADDIGRSLSGKALFTARIESALEEGAIHVAVHSLKDLPAQSSPGLTIGAFPPREDARDAWVSRAHTPLEDLPRDAVVATSSLRRIAQLRSHQPGLRIETLRGNVGTRLRKLEESSWDGIVLAAAGLRRLGLQARISHPIPTDVMLPAPGQGALAIQIRRNDPSLARLVASIDDSATRVAVEAERAFSQTLGGDCNVPVAAHAQRNGRQLRLIGRVLTPGGDRVVQGSMTGPADDPKNLGERLASHLLEQGADRLLEGIVR